MGLWVLGAVPASASEAPDQGQPFFSGAQTLRNPMAQTFTPGGSGSVARVSLMINTTQGASAITVQIQTVAAGKPSGTVLGSTSSTAQVACCHRWQDFTFNPAVPVSGGTQYAIVVRPTGFLTWYANFGTDEYTAGQLWLSSGSSWLGGRTFGYDFCFQTYLTTGVTNHAPSVAVANAAVTANEGSPVANHGTFSDPDGDTVSLSASSGTVLKSGTSSGSWSWSTPAADEAPAQTVTITADDGHGGTATASFTYTIAAVAPTVSIAASPAGAPEGTAVTLTGRASGPSAADNAAGFTLTWTVTKDGNPFAVGFGPTATFTPDDEGVYAATLQAVDDGGASASTSVNLNGVNVAPTARITSVTHDTLVLVAQQPVTVTGGFTDPGVLDTHTGSVDFGDGSAKDTYSFGAGAAPDTIETHVYTAPGTYTITYAVTDDDGGAGSASVQVTVLSPAQALGVIQSYAATMSSLNGGEKNGLSAKLRAAIASASRGDTNATCGQLDAFLNDLVALTKNGRLSAADSAALSSSAWTVHRALGCTKIKVAWLSLSL